jgi:serine/threonine protein kinase
MNLRISAAPEDFKSKTKASAFDQAFKIERTLQKCIYGRVVLARHRVSQNLRAVKIVEKSLVRDRRSRTGQAVIESAASELTLLTLLRDEKPHPHLATLAPVSEQFEDDNRAYLAMPFANKGDLFSYVDAFQDDSSETGAPVDGKPASWAQREAARTVRRLFGQIVAAVLHLHKHVGWAHNDLSLENVLLHREATGAPLAACVCDYGLALPLGAPWDARRRKAGKMPYQAPEIYAGRVPGDVCGASGDIFSLGVMLFMMLFHTPPFEVPHRSDRRFAHAQMGPHGLNELLRLWGLKDELRSAVAAADGACGAESLLSLLHGMLRDNPLERVTLADVAAHPWVSGATSALARATANAIPPPALRSDVAGHLAAGSFRGTVSAAIPGRGVYPAQKRDANAAPPSPTSVFVCDEEKSEGAGGWAEVVASADAGRA